MPPCLLFVFLLFCSLWVLYVILNSISLTHKTLLSLIIKQPQSYTEIYIPNEPTEVNKIHLGTTHCHKQLFVFLVVQSCLTPCDHIDCNLPASSVHADSPGKNTGVGSHSLLQGIFPTQGSNPGLPHCRQILYCLNHQGSPKQQFTTL